MNLSRKQITSIEPWPGLESATEHKRFHIACPCHQLPWFLSSALLCIRSCRACLFIPRLGPNSTRCLVPTVSSPIVLGVSLIPHRLRIFMSTAFRSTFYLHQSNYLSASTSSHRTCHRLWQDKVLLVFRIRAPTNTGLRLIYLLSV